MIGLLLGYVVSFVLVLLGIGMVIRSRRAMNGLARGLIAMALLLLIRRVDDVSHLFGAHLLDDTVTMVLSLMVSIVFVMDVRTIDKMRDLYTQWHADRADKIRRLEEQRFRSERGSNWDHQDGLAKQVRNITNRRSSR